MLVLVLVHLSRNKTLVRENLLILLNKLLGSHDIEQLVAAQHRVLDLHKKGKSGAVAPAAAVTAVPNERMLLNSPSGAAQSASLVGALDGAAAGGDGVPGDLSRLPTDLKVWFSMFKFMDAFDDREGQQVQVTLAWYGAFVLFCCAMVLVAWAKSWAGIDQLVVFVTCATIAVLVGACVVYILFNGVQINELPADMHAAMRRAEMRIVVALAIVQRQENDAAVAGGAAGSLMSSAALTSRCSLQVAASLLERFASSFEFSVLSSPFTVLMFPLTKTLISTGVVAGFTALSSIIAATVTGAVGEVV